MQLFLRIQSSVTEIRWNDKINEPNIKVLELNKKLFEAVKKYNFKYLDYYSLMVGDLENLTYDGLHPNKKGYLKMETILTGAIKNLSAKTN